MIPFVFQLDLFRDADRAYSHRSLDILLRALTAIDIEYLQLYPQTPMLYESGVRYQVEAPGKEEWQDIPTTLEKGVLDCEDAACWRAAEVNVRYGIKAYPFFISNMRPDGSLLYHIKVRYPNGREEDPSRVLGMK